MAYDKGRHDRHTAANQKARFHLRGGMARMALEAKRSGKPVEDSVGRPLAYCNEMADRHGHKTLEKWVRASDRPAMVGMSMTVDTSNPKAARWPR